MSATAFLFFSICLNAEVFTLKNSQTEFSLDSGGNLLSLKNLQTGRQYAGGGGLWRIIYQDGISLEESLEAENTPIKIEKKSDTEMVLSYGGEFPVTVSCTLDGDEIKLRPEIKNASKDKILREFQFPMIKNAKITDQSQMYWTFGGGMYFPKLRQWLIEGFQNYMAQDNKAIERYILYPGETAMNYYVINEPSNSLYIASHDPNFEKTLHLVRARKTGGPGDFEYGGADFGMVKYPFLNPGESKKYPEFVLSAHNGDWHVSAKKYRKWADSWYKTAKPLPMVRNSNGWQRIIFRHQYGKTLFSYKQLPEIYKVGKEAGIDTVLMFGWWKEGMDAGYPEYTPDDTQGGDEALKKYVKEVQDMGGKVILYFNGQLIDMGTKFYRRLGKKISIKRADGTEHMERYPFGGDGTALRVFGNKTFVTACPGTKEWLNILKSFVDRAVEIGVDGIEFDQLGYKSEFCYDKSHGHSVPCQDIMLLKSKMLGELRAYVRQKKPDMPLYIEWMSDPTSMHADFIHNCVVNLHIADTDKNGVPITRYAPMYQYTFPETYTTDRDIYNNSDVPRRNNLAVMRGWRSDVAVYRCRATIGETPVYKSYLTEINRLRDRFRDLILNGVFRDTDMAKSDNPLLEYSTFTTWDGEKMAVVVAQSHFDFARVQFTPADGYEYLEDGGIGSFKVLKNENNKATVELKRNDIAVIVFKKASSANRNVDKGAGILQSAL